MTKNTIGNTVLAALTLASTLGVASASGAHAPAYDAMWSAIGSAGMVQAGTTVPARTTRAILSIGDSGTVIARYPVTPSEEFANADGVLHLVANLNDPGLGASITVSLMEVPVGRPGESAEFHIARPILTVESTDLTPRAYVNECVNDGGAVRLDFESNVYFIQARLNWDATAQPRAPALRAIQLAVYPFKKCGS